jgi:hypothetical protein
MKSIRIKNAGFVQDQKSQILIVSLIVMVLVFTLGAGLLFNSRTSRDLSGLEVEIQNANSLAKSGVRITEAVIAKSLCGAMPVNATYTLGAGTISIEVDSSAMTFTSTGRSGQSTDVIEKSFELLASSGANFLREITLYSLDTHGINADLIGFPVLVQVTLDKDNVTQSDGGDIYFTAADGTTQLDHEIEDYDASTGDLVAWVKIPLLQETSDTTINLFYGTDDTGLPDQWNREAVWDSNYVAVWHMSENPSINTDGHCNPSEYEICDSTSYNNDLNKDQSPVTTTGKIAKAVDFERNDEDSLERLDDGVGSSLDVTGDLTIEAWIRSESTASNQTVIHKWRDVSGSENAGPYRARYQESNKRMQFQVCSDRNESSYCDTNQDSSPPDLNINVWHYVSYVHDDAANELRNYTDSILLGGVSHSGGIYDSSAEFQIGKRGGGQEFDGKIDEVRISNTVRSPDWLKATYVNQENVLDFMNFDGEQVCN